jgi:hypothetical protein
MRQAEAAGDRAMTEACLKGQTQNVTNVVHGNPPSTHTKVSFLVKFDDEFSRRGSTPVWIRFQVEGGRYFAE